MEKKIKISNIILYTLIILIILFFSVFLMLSAYFSIPESFNGITLDRYFSNFYLIIFGVIAFVFGLCIGYAFLSELGRKTSHEVFEYRKKYLVYFTCVVTFSLVYYIVELLIGYIILNFNNPNSNIHTHGTNTLLITKDKIYSNLDYSVTLDKTNLFDISNQSFSSISNSNITHIGNGKENSYNCNTIFSTKENSNLFIDKTSLSIDGKYSEIIYLKNSSSNANSSKFNVSGDSSLVLFSNNSDSRFVLSDFNCNASRCFVIKNGSSLLFENNTFNFYDTNNNYIYITDDNTNETNTIVFKNNNLSFNSGNLFNIDSSKVVITIDSSVIDFDLDNSFLINLTNSDLELNITNSTVVGSMKGFRNSNLKINLVNSKLISNISDISSISLVMDKQSEFISASEINLNEYSNEDTNNENLTIIDNHLYVNNEIIK